ncbi:FKBP12-associated protein [Fusarium torreyae]|uniref:FKBP12-associated protein n=1 Tax=Fusarium torreyae TaxID=1237075 RepID=A0A9W8SBP1_9HYPO|nr:FKBP12-associated protein [Fusarium torreyae]
MAEQESGQASNQAQNHTQNRPQNEGQGSASGSRGGSRGGRRRGRGGRNRGQRQDGSAQGFRGRGNASSQTDAADTAVATLSTTAPTEPAASAAPESSGASRGRRNRRGNRGGARGSGDQGRGTFSVGPRRQFGGRLTTTQDSTEAATQDPSLSAAAPEFVPGQPVPQRSAPQPSSGSQPAAQPRSRGTRNRNRKQDRPRQEAPKSTASELWQRIQEDIANWNYECRVCTEEVTRKTEAWSCTTCWTVVHLECAHQWWDTSMKVNEETGDKSWRCPGCNSILTDEPGDYKSVRTPVEEPTTAVFTVVKRPATHKTSFQLIAPSLQMLSVIVLVERRHSRISWTTHASLARSMFPTARGSVRRRCNAVTCVSLCAISGTVSLAHRPLKSIADVVELRLRQSVMKETSKILCVFEFARPHVTAADIAAESIAVLVRRKHLSELPSRRSSVLVPNPFPSKPSISAFSPVGDHSSAVVTFASSSAIAEPAKAALRLFGPKSAATAAPRSFIHRNPVALASHLAQTSVGDSPLADIPLLIISVILMT